ncbi:MAG: HEPN domain-containing protein [Syntrophobacteraceae bacterium]|jgi:HEPN domain-containing protein
MKPHIEEAQRSLRTAIRDIKAFNVLKDASDIDLATVCFHAQQAIEKSLKAVLFLHQIESRRTHDLVLLTQLLRQHGIEPPATDGQMSRLNPFAVMMRYDDMEINIISRHEAANMVAIIYSWAEELVQSAAGGPDEPVA